MNYIPLIIALFNIHMGYTLRDSQHVLGKWIQALNYIFGGANLVVFASKITNV